MILLLSIVIIFQVYLAPKLHEFLEHEFDSNQLNVLQSLGAALVPGLLTNDLAAIHELLIEQKKLHPEWKQLVVLNSNNNRVYPLKKLNMSKEYGHRLNKSIYYYGRHVGDIEIIADSISVHKQEDTIKEIFYILLAAFLMMIIIVAWMQNYIVIRPINLLSNAATKLSKGDFDFKLPAVSSDEIGKLASSFSLMQENINSYQRKLQTKAVYIETILDNVFNAIITTNQWGVILSFNKAAEEIFGYKSDEVLGGKLNMLMVEQDAMLHDIYIYNYKKTNYSKVIGKGREISCKRKDGSTFTAEVAVNVTHVDGKNIFTGVIRDISEQRASEEALASQQLLISTINQAQALYIYSGDPVILFNAILTVVIELTGSEYGLIGEALIDDDGDQYLKAYAATNIAWDDETRMLYDQYEGQGMDVL